MALRISKGNMYEFVTHTWNTIKGACEHDCKYCFMKRWGGFKHVRFDEKECQTNIGSGNFIFVGSSNDIFSKSKKKEWVTKTLEHCNKHDNSYLFQSKNPGRIHSFKSLIPKNTTVCTTIETNRFYSEWMGNTPTPQLRAEGMSILDLPRYVTIEPIMDFDLQELVKLIYRCKPVQVNIGAATGGHVLPEPTKYQVMDLINELNKFTTVAKKKNLKRLLETG